MVDSNEVNKKQMYKYVPPTPPSNLIDSTTFVLDFTNRKFLHIGFDSYDNFNIVIHIITPSRFINISPQYLKRIYSLMGNILSFVLDMPQKYTDRIFLSDDTITLSKTIYRGQNMLVLNSEIQEGCRVLLERRDIFVLQNLENAIFDSITRKASFARPNILYQFNQAVNALADRNGIDKIEDINQMMSFISRISNEEMDIFVPPSQPNFINQIKLFALEQLSKQLLKQKAELESKVI
jgi:hypothetical protein